MTTRTAPGRRAVLLAGILTAVVVSSSECDVGCEPGDPSGPDGWRLSTGPDPTPMPPGPRRP